MFESGSSYREISETIGTPISTLRVWAKRDSWSRTKIETDDLILPADTVDADVPDDLPSQQEEYQSNMAKTAVLVSRRVVAMQPDEVIAKSDKLNRFDTTARKSLKLESDKPVPVINLAVLCGNSPTRAAALKDAGDQGQLRSTHRPAQLIEAE